MADNKDKERTELLSKLLADRGQNRLTEEKFWAEMKRNNLTQLDIDVWWVDHQPLGSAFMTPSLFRAD